MPRAERPIRPRTVPYPTCSPVKAEKSPSPDPISATESHAASRTPSPSPNPTKAKARKRSTGDTESPSKGKGYNYDRGLLVSLVAKVCQLSIPLEKADQQFTHADFMALGGIVNKSASRESAQYSVKRADHRLCPSPLAPYVVSSVCRVQGYVAQDGLSRPP